MINRIKLLKNIGQFDNVSPPQEASFSPFSLIYGENGRGKTTIVAILRSVSSGETTLVTDRQRLGAQNPPHVVINQADGNNAIFQDGDWDNLLPNIAIFDDAFVSENVYSGIEVDIAHRRGLHELILGAQGVALNNTLQNNIQSIEDHNAEIRRLSNEIPANVRRSYTIDDFCNLEEDNEIDNKIQEAERRLAAARSEDMIRQSSIFQEFNLPDFDIEKINSILGRSLPDIEAEATKDVQSHISKIGEGGEEWVSDGIPRMLKVSKSEGKDICPFCTRDLEGLQIIKHYQTYFSQAYKNLKEVIRQVEISVSAAHRGDVQSAFERNIRMAIQTREFWKDFAELPQIEIDTEAIACDWNAAYNAIFEQLRIKAATPLEKREFTRETCQAIQDYQKRITEVSALSRRLIGANNKLNAIKGKAQANNLAELQADLSKLMAQKARFDPAIVLKCNAYLAEKKTKIATENLRDKNRMALNQYRERIFPTYQTSINHYLCRLNASFRLDKVQFENTRVGSSASYCLVINKQNVEIAANEGTSFRNTLSAGDRNALALAFFFTSLEQESNLANKIVVIDDPMTSLDEHRMLCTQTEILNMAQRVQQVIVLSHSKPFLCSLWEKANKSTPAAICIKRVADGSQIGVWDVQNDSISDHDKRHERIRDYIRQADPNKEREVASDLRPTLEAFIRVAYPEHFLPGGRLGQFLDMCRRKAGTDDKILSSGDIDELSDLLEYANKFHHDTRSGSQQADINDTELVDFARRTLLFTSRM